MSLPVLIRRAAELDLMRAEDWYEAQRPGLGHDFRHAVDAAIARLAENPLAYPDRYQGAPSHAGATIPVRALVTGHYRIESSSLRVSTANAIPERSAPDFIQ